MRHACKIFLSLLLIAVFSCKKQNNNTNTTPGSTSNAGVSGQLTYRMIIKGTAGSAATSFFIEPTFTFFDPPLKPNVPPPGFADVGNVTVNSVALAKLSGLAIYSVHNDSINTLPLFVNISGNGNFAATTFSDSGTFFPSFSNSHQIPDTISKSAGFSLSLSNLVHTALVEYSIGPIRDTTSVNNLVLSPAQLSSLNPGSIYSMTLSCLPAKNETFTASGRNYESNYRLDYIKTGLTIAP